MITKVTREETKARFTAILPVTPTYKKVKKNFLQKLFGCGDKGGLARKCYKMMEKKKTLLDL